MASLLTKYRPKTFDEVIGQTAAIKALRGALKRGDAHTFLFVGPSGTGKTTLARLTAAEVGCVPANLTEIDAATHTGIEDMRTVAADQLYKPWANGMKGVIVDEFHALSKPAVQSLLKILEEPPEWLFWFLCTTEPTKVPEAIKTRSLTIALKPVAEGTLFAYLLGIAEREKLDVDDDVIELCAKEANGSPRQGVANLTLCATAKDAKVASDLLRSASDSAEVIDLCRALVRGARWAEVQKLLAGLTDKNPESIRHVVRAYVTKVVLNAKGEPAAGRGIEILDAFSEPFHSADGIAPVIIACGRLLLR